MCACILTAVEKSSEAIIVGELNHPRTGFALETCTFRGVGQTFLQLLQLNAYQKSIKHRCGDVRPQWILQLLCR